MPCDRYNAAANNGLRRLQLADTFVSFFCFCALFARRATALGLLPLLYLIVLHDKQLRREHIDYVLKTIDRCARCTEIRRYTATDTQLQILLG